MPRSEATKVNRAGSSRRAEADVDHGTLKRTPSTGVRVVELAQWVFVPVAGALLADWGADVVRIERPTGDPYRGLMTQGIGTDRGGVNLSMALANRGKRSVALDLRNEQGREVFGPAARVGRRVAHQPPARALERLGLDADDVRARYPPLVYARGHGYGARGPDADHAGLRRVRPSGPAAALRTC